MAAQELRWLTYLLTDLGEQPRSPPVLYVDNKAMLALCREHRLEHRTKHIALRYFLARELQQRGQLRLAYVASEANTTDIFTKAFAPACFALLDWSCDLLFSPTLPMGNLFGRDDGLGRWSGHTGWAMSGQLAGGWDVGAKQADVEGGADVPVSGEEEVGCDRCDHVADAKWPAISGAEFRSYGQAEVLGVE
ncbi:unnamed protein product [Closterium sp. NIES-53]